MNAINVMRGAESVSSYAPIPDAEKFRVEYWELEERKLQMRPPPPVAGRARRVRHRRRHRASGARSPNGSRDEGACVVVADLDGERGREGRGRDRRPNARWRSRST